MICPGDTVPTPPQGSRTRDRVHSDTREPAPHGLDVSGTLIAAPDGPFLLAADNGILYVVNDPRGFVAGDRVRVTGMCVPLYVTIYEHGDACILNHAITACGSARPYRDNVSSPRAY